MHAGQMTMSDEGGRLMASEPLSGMDIPTVVETGESNVPSTVAEDDSTDVEFTVSSSSYT